MIFMLAYVKHEQDQLDADLALQVPTAATKTGSAQPTEEMCLSEAVDRLSPTVRCVPSAYSGTASLGSHSLQEFYESGSRDVH